MVKRGKLSVAEMSCRDMAIEHQAVKSSAEMCSEWAQPKKKWGELPVLAIAGRSCTNG